MPILFVDFDGVLHPADAARHQLFCHLPALEAVLRPLLNVEIVLTTQWRESAQFDELVRPFQSILLVTSSAPRLCWSRSAMNGDIGSEKSQSGYAYIVRQAAGLLFDREEYF